MPGSCDVAKGRHAGCQVAVTAEGRHAVVPETWVSNISARVEGVPADIPGMRMSCSSAKTRDVMQ